MFLVANSGSSAAAPQDDFWYSFVPMRAGIGSACAPMRLSAVFGCVRVLAETVGQLPLILYRRLPGGGKVRATEHPLYQLLAQRPNGLQTSLEWREMMQGHLELRGNAYSRIESDVLGRPVALWPMHPDCVKVEFLVERNRLRYRYKGPDGVELALGQDEVLHLRGLQSDGFVGLNPIEAQARTLGVAAAAEAFGERVFTNDTAQGGWIEHPANFKDKEQRDNYRSAWRDQVRTGGVPIMEYGMKYHEVGMKMTDAQFLEQRKYNAAEIASRIFRVPPHKIGLLDRGTWANIESQNIEFATESLVSRLRRWEQRLNESLLTDEEQPVYFFEFLLDGLLRGDSGARSAYFERALRNRWLVPNEVREIENLNPVEWGDAPLPMPNESLRGGGAREALPDREARAGQLELAAAEAVVRKEANALQALVRKAGAGGQLRAALDACYRDELVPFLAKALAVDQAAGERYAADSIQAFMATHPDEISSVLRDWKAFRAEHLLEVIRER